MKAKQMFALMAVLALGILAVGVVADGSDADTAEKTYVIAFDGEIAYDDVAAIFTTATKDTVSYETALDLDAVDGMTVMNMKSWEAIEDFVDDGKIIYTAQQYEDAADQKKVDSGLKAFGMGDTKTVVTIKVAAEKDTTVSYEIYSAGEVDRMIADASVGGFTQADIDKAVEEATAGLYTQADIDKAVEEAKASVPVSDAQTWQIVCIILGALAVILGLFGGKAMIELKKAGGKLF